MESDQEASGWALISGWCAQALILDDNSFSSWQRLRPLASLPSLQRLSLNGNLLSSLQHANSHHGACPPQLPTPDCQPHEVLSVHLTHYSLAFEGSNCFVKRHHCHPLGQQKSVEILFCSDLLTAKLSYALLSAQHSDRLVV